jgi:tetratricopeptide (TPR) repeat protein
MSELLITPKTELQLLASLTVMILLVSSCTPGTEPSSNPPLLPASFDDPAQSVEQHLAASEAAFSRGDVNAAEAEARRALDLAERRFGPNDQRTGQPLMLLTSLYRVKGRHEEAKRFAERAFNITEKTFGPDHLETAAAMSMLASLYSSTGDIARAEGLWRRAVAIKEKGFGPDHPYTAVTASQLADLLTEKGEYAEAVRLHNRSLAALEKAWPPHEQSLPIGFRLNVPTVMEGLAYALVGQGRSKEAEDLVTRAASLRLSLVGSAHVSMIGNKKILGHAYLAQGRDADAEKTLREALHIAEKTTGSENSTVSDLMAMVADSCLRQAKKDAAADLYARSVAIDEKTAAPRSLRAKHLQGYANVLKAMNRTQEAATAEQRVKEMR